MTLSPPPSSLLLCMAVQEFESKRNEYDVTVCNDNEKRRRRDYCRVFENTTPFYDNVKERLNMLRWVHVVLELSKDADSAALNQVVTTCLFELIPCKCKYGKQDMLEEKDVTVVFMTLCLSKKEPSHHIVSDFLKALNIFNVVTI